MEPIDNHASLDKVIFPGLVICSPNKFKQSFILWIHDNLFKYHKMFGTFDDKIKSEDKEAQFLSMLLKYFFDGSEKPITKQEEEYYKTLTNSDFIWNYFHNFTLSLNTSSIDISDDTTLLIPSDIVEIDFPIQAEECETGKKVCF